MSGPNTINFLPPSYIKSQARRHRRLRQFTLAGVMVGCLCVWWLGQKGQTVALERYAAALEVEAAAAVEQRGELVRLREEHKVLTNQVKVQRELAQPVRHVQIIAALGQTLPASVMLTDLNMTTLRPPPRKIEDKSKSTAASKRKTPAKTERVADEVRIDLEALAPDDMTVAEVVAAISDHPLFDGVRMESSREIERYGVIGRKFKLSTTVPLDRVFLEPVTGQEVAHVDD